ncbi:hypothetical protein G6F24_016285 [Rhizopus arrhizus]|nr:hypothetical protein G6F24_016285 [Rhizopus arrhizus]
MTSPRLAGATAVNNNGGHLPEPTDGYGQAPAVGNNDTPRHAPYMPRPDRADLPAHRQLTGTLGASRRPCTRTTPAFAARTGAAARRRPDHGHPCLR